MSKMEFKKIDKIEDLKVGDIIRGGTYGLAYIVTDHHGSSVTAVRTVNVTNPIEWEILTTLSQSDNQ